MIRRDRQILLVVYIALLAVMLYNEEISDLRSFLYFTSLYFLIAYIYRYAIDRFKN